MAELCEAAAQIQCRTRPVRRLLGCGVGRRDKGPGFFGRDLDPSDGIPARRAVHHIQLPFGVFCEAGDAPGPNRTARTFQSMGRNMPLPFCSGLIQRPDRLWQLTEKKTENFLFQLDIEIYQPLLNLMLAKKEQDRYQNCADIITDINSLLASGVVSHTTLRNNATRIQQVSQNKRAPHPTAFAGNHTPSRDNRNKNLRMTGIAVSAPATMILTSPTNTSTLSSPLHPLTTNWQQPRLRLMR